MKPCGLGARKRLIPKTCADHFEQSRNMSFVTRDGLTLSAQTLFVIRILEIVSAFGALHIFWFGR
jgi:hypothetical protein